MIDAGRLARAKTYKVVPLGERKYKVGDYYVDLDGETPCHCRDALLSVPEPTACKHVLSAALYEGWKP